jgi:hypothetical protein
LAVTNENHALKSTRDQALAVKYQFPIKREQDVQQVLGPIQQNAVVRELVNLYTEDCPI